MFDKPPSDPREQDVEEVRYGLPRPLVTDPVHVQALRAELPLESCAACGHKTWLHYDTLGLVWIGCLGARNRIALNLTDAHHYVNDAHPFVRRQLEMAFDVALGPAMASFTESIGHTGRDELALRIVDIVVTAYLKESGR